jgi:putative hydrolase of the HAD superfamily
MYCVRPLEDRLVELFPNIEITSAIMEEMCTLFLRPIFDRAKLDPEALSTLAAVRERGIRTAIVSNTPWGSSAKQWAAEVERHGLATLVDEIVFCVDVGWRKPAPQIFQRALSLLGVEARDALFVGDDPRWDVAGAEQSGLCPVLLNPSGEFTNDRCRCIRSLKELLPLLDEAPLQ